MRITATADVSGFRSAVAATLNHLELTVQKAPIKAATLAVDRARSTTAFKDDTGTLRRSIHANAGRFSPRDSWVEFCADADYAVCIEGGTMPHEIWPKEGHGFIGPLRTGQSRRDITDIGTHRVALRWYEGSTPVFRYMVNHPGNAPMPFMWPAAYDAEDEMIDYVRSAFVGIQSLWG